MVPFLTGLLLCLAQGALPQRDVLPGESSRADQTGSAGPERASRPVDEVRMRLASLPEPRRQSLERHLEEFEQLSPAARRKLLERARALQERERSLQRGAARPERHERLREEFRAQGRELRQRLPDGLRRRLEKAEPEQRRRLLERLSQDRDRFSRRAIGEMKTRQRLTAREARRLERLPVEERVRALRELSGPARGRPGRPTDLPGAGG